MEISIYVQTWEYVSLISVTCAHLGAIACKIPKAEHLTFRRRYVSDVSWLALGCTAACWCVSVFASPGGGGM